MAWFKCVDKTFSFKVQYINEYLASRLIADMESRDDGTFALDEEHSCLQEEVHYELGGYGMYAMNQPRHTFEVSGNRLQIDDAQAHEWMLKLTDAKRRTFADGTEYIKLYSRFSCLILTQSERESLLFQIKGKMEEMNKASDDFLEDFEKGWAKMKEDYESEHGREFPIIRMQDLQPDKEPN